MLKHLSTQIATKPMFFSIIYGLVYIRFSNIIVLDINNALIILHSFTCHSEEAKPEESDLKIGPSLSLRMTELLRMTFYGM